MLHPLQERHGLILGSSRAAIPLWTFIHLVGLLPMNRLTNTKKKTSLFGAPPEGRCYTSASRAAQAKPGKQGSISPQEFESHTALSVGF
jgi:hypothetical protein